nr:uncharacterized protein LOC123770187 [Procambarus clarkii]
MKSWHLLTLVVVSLVEAGTHTQGRHDHVSDGDLKYGSGQSHEHEHEHSHEHSHELGCSAQRLCDENEGVCKRSCNGPIENEVHAGCSGSGCKCCTRKNTKCTSTEECKEHRGKCTQSKCKSTEVQIRGGCRGRGCRCCARSFRDGGEVTAGGEAVGVNNEKGTSEEQTKEETVVKQEGGEESVMRGDEDTGEEEEE